MMIALLVFIYQTCSSQAVHKTGFPLLAVHEKSIIAVKDKSNEVLAQRSASVDSVQFYELDGHIYFLNRNELKKQALDSLISETLLSFPETMEVTDLILDPQTGFLFFTDSLNQTIYTSKVGEFIKPIIHFKKKLQTVRDIKLDTVDMWLFVLVQVGSVSEIYQFQYNGESSSPQPLQQFSSTNCLFAVDSLTKRLYVLDKYEKYVHVLNYNSTQSVQLAPIPLSTVVSVTSMSVSNNTLYITGSKINGVLVLDLVSQLETFILPYLGYLSDLVLMIPVAVFTPSLCSSSYCHQLCSGNLGNTTADNDGSVAKIECFCGTGYSNPGNSGNPGNPGDSGNTDESYCQMDSTGGQLFVCQDSGLLVSTDVKCNDVNDCWDYSDEKNCECEGFVCDGLCIPSSNVCDSVSHCPRAEDEQCCDDNVTCCHGNAPGNAPCECKEEEEMKCEGGGCVGVGRWCDGVQDCTDRSDELNCTDFREHSFKCSHSNSTRYIPLLWRCDGRYDCSDFSDEALCLGGGCSPTQLSCDNGRCLDAQYLCDGVVHCKDKTDEMNCQNATCQNGMLPCADGTCLSSDLFCNGVADCNSSTTIFTDELCDFDNLLCPQSQFKCDADQCIPQGWVCDGTSECTGGEDELNCPALEDTDSVTCDSCTCDTDSDCSQSCISGKCTCNDGYTMSTTDNKTCEATSPATVYFTTNSGLYTAQLRGGVFSAVTSLTYQHSHDISSFDMFSKTGLIIAASGGQILAINLTGKHTVDVIVKREREIRSVAVDWVNDNIYWIEDNTLMMSNTQYSGLRSLSSDVSDVKLDVKYNTLYYTTTQHALVRCRLDMTECNTMLQDVVQLCLDQVSRNIYYTSLNNSLYRLSNTGVSHLLTDSLTTDTVNQIVYFESSVYYTTGSELRSYNKLTGSNTPVTLQSAGTPVSPARIILGHASLQPSSPESPCKDAQCSQLCTQSVPGTAQCLCSNDYKLSDSQCIYTGEECIGVLRCDDRRCMRDESERCDDFRDCYDGSDELHCNTTCGENEWQCEVGGCVHSSLRCDTAQDCVGGSDERNCSGLCDSGFLCNSGQCINSKLQCNKHPDCPDKSDEDVGLCGHVACASGTFECEPNHCIPLSWTCDGYSDCSNGTDEMGCDSDQCVVRCDERGSGEARCLPASAQCNGIPDCEDGTDETDCSTETTWCKDWEFTCEDGSTCISFLLRCDGVAQCNDKSDEALCDECKEGYTRCDNGQCVHPRYKCDGNRDCPLGEDELECSECSPDQISCDSSCLPLLLRCDGENDCSDGSDEADCVSPHCSPAQFMCLSGACIDKHYRCDSSLDCSDGSDEDNCSVCSLSHFLCDTGLCLDQESVCNGVDECGDGSDERGCDTDPVNECLSRPCDLEHGQCVDLRLGYYCSCDQGYELARNKKYCIDTDECDLRVHDRQCTQLCYNTVGGFACGCVAGYSLDRRDHVTCRADSPLSYLLLSHHSVFSLSEVSYYNHTRELVLYDLPDSVHHIAAHITSTSTLLYTAEGSSIKRYILPPLTLNTSLDPTEPILDRGTLENVHVSSLAVDWSTGNLYWSDPVLGEIKLYSPPSGRSVTVVTTHCDKVRGLVLLPQRGKMYFIHVYQGVSQIAETGLDGTRRRRVTGRGEVVSHFDIDHITTTLYYFSSYCADPEHDFCMYKIELQYPTPKTQLLESGDMAPYETLTAFRAFGSHRYLAMSRRGVLDCKLYQGWDCRRLTTNETQYTDILFLSPLSQPHLENACGVDTCGEGAVCVNTAVDALGTQLHTACVCEGKDEVYEKGKCKRVERRCDEEIYFSCQSGGCVETRFRCDKVRDCTDGSDEMGCEEFHCNHLVQFSCRNGNQCVPIERLCDGFKDCADNSDEDSCTASLCSESDFMCNSTKTCVPGLWRCDGTEDCLEGEDEKGCCHGKEEGCGECSGFQCLNNNKRLQCYSDSVVGDGKVDCYYSVDEDKSEMRCESGTFLCNSLCYPDNWRCNGEVDCGDGESCEMSCDKDHVLHGGRCVSKSLVCDGWRDLEGGEDEEGCFVSCDLNYLPCNGMCVPSNSDWLCDGYCGDEVVSIYHQIQRGCECGASQRQCKSGRCQDTSFWCDKEVDCLHEDDEVWCPGSDCAPPDFCCSYSGRILRDSVGVCDGADDCLDGSDELLCPAVSYPQCAPEAYDCETDETLEKRCIFAPKCDNSTAHQRHVCTNQRDVMRCNHGDPCSANNGGCAQVCNPLPDNTRQCSCFLGYYLDSDGRTCKDIDECKDPNTCSQVCTNLKGSYTCSCMAGFVKWGGDGSSCKLQSGPTQVLISTEFDMRISSPSSLTKVTSGKRASFKFSFYSAESGNYYFVVGLVDKYRLYKLVDSQEVFVTELKGHVADLEYNPLTNNIVYCNSHSVNILSLNRTLASTTVYTDILRPVQKLALSPRSGMIFYTRNWMLGVMKSDGSVNKYLATDNSDMRTYQFKDGRVTSISVDEPAKRVYWYDSDLQQLSSASYSGRRVKTVLSKLKHVQQIRVFGDHVIYHTGKELWSVEKRGRSVRVKRESLLPRCSHISVVTRSPAVLDQCRECGVCLIDEGAGPACYSNHDNTCGCVNGGKCNVATGGEMVCECLPGYHGDTCELLDSGSRSTVVIIIDIVVAIVVFCFVLFLIALCYICKRRNLLSKFKDFITGKLFKVPPSVRYSRHTSSVTTNNNSVEYGIFNEGCEEYDLEEINTDQCHLMEDNLEDQEDVI